MSALRFHAPLLRPPESLLQAIEVVARVQLPGIQIIGLPGPEVAEARERIGAALDSLNLPPLTRRIVLNLTPAAVRKRGTLADFAMALACLHALHPKSIHKNGEFLAMGELGLHGEIKPCAGLAATLLLAVQHRVPFVLIPADLQGEADLALRAVGEGVADQTMPQVLGFRNLKEAWEWLQGDFAPPMPRVSVTHSNFLPQSTDEETSSLYRLSPIQQRWAGIIASGRHHALVLGMRGSGKSHFLEWAAALRGDLTAEESLWRWSQGLGSSTRNSSVRRVQPEISAAALLGSVVHGVDQVRLGELTLAHGGVLIANEFLEWKRPSRECLREPLESGEIYLTALHGRMQLPARFQLLASANWCECGDSKHPQDACRCSPYQKRNYWRRLSGPLLDRMDFCMSWTHSPQSSRSSLAHPDEIRNLRARVLATQDSLRTHWGVLPGEPGAGKSAHFWKEKSSELEQAQNTLSKLLNASAPISRRSEHQVLRLAATLHAWDQPQSSEPWSKSAIAEAALYRKQIEQWTAAH